MLDCIPYTNDTPQPTVFHFPCHRLYTYSDATSPSSTCVCFHSGCRCCCCYCFSNISCGCVNGLFQFRRPLRTTAETTLRSVNFFFFAVFIAIIALLVLCYAMPCHAGACEVETITQTANRWYKLIEKHFHLHILFRMHMYIECVCMRFSLWLMASLCFLLLLLIHSFALNFLFAIGDSFICHVIYMYLF